MLAVQLLVAISPAAIMVPAAEVSAAISIAVRIAVAIRIPAKVAPDPSAIRISHHGRRRVDRIHGVGVSRPSYDNADSYSSLRRMRSHCQHAQQGDCRKSDFLKHLFHPPLHSTRRPHGSL
jgi:hypothetical protein